MDAPLLALGRETVMLVLLVSAAPLLAALLIGLLSGVLQAATQVQEQALGVVPRLLAVFLALGVTAPWIGARLARFAEACLQMVPRISP